MYFRKYNKIYQYAYILRLIWAIFMLLFAESYQSTKKNYCNQNKTRRMSSQLYSWIYITEDTNILQGHKFYLKMSVTLTNVFKLWYDESSTFLQKLKSLSQIYHIANNLIHPMKQPAWKPIIFHFISIGLL